MPQYLVGPTRTYTTINAAVVAIPNGLSGLHEVIIDPGVYDELVVIPSKGASSGTILLRPESGFEARGIFDSPNNVIIRPSSSGTPLTIQQTRVTVKDIQITRTNVGSFNVLSLTSSQASFENCLFKVHSNTRVNSNGIIEKTFYKCIAWSVNGNSTLSAFNDVGSTGVTYVNCGVYGFSSGFTSSTGQAGTTCRNCWYESGDNATSGVGFSLIGGISRNNASSGSNAPGSGSFTNVSAAQFGFVDPANGNFHITEDSILYNAGLALPSLFTEDIDLEIIAFWSIGPDCITIPEPTPTTSSSPWVNQNEPHDEVEDASPPSLKFKSGEPSSQLESQSRNRDARPPNLKIQSPDASRGLDAGSDVRDVGFSAKSFPKGYKDGFLSIMPETGGYVATPTYGTGNRLPILWESLVYGMEFTELDNVRPSRESRTRVALDYNPSGEILFPTRTNDSIALFQSHFQKRLGTTPATGTTYYEFHANRDRITMSGSSWGTGSYNSSGNYSAFTVAAYKRIGTNAYRFAHGLCDKLRFSIRAKDEAYTRASMVFNNGTIVPITSVYPTGSYSTLAPFPSYSINVDFLGLPLVGFEIESNNNIKTLKNVTSGSSIHRFGRYQVDGVAVVDLETTSLSKVGSMLGGSTFSCSATLYSNERNRMILQMPECRIKPFEMVLNSNTLSMPFSCYESEDGGTAPLTIKLWTTGYSATTFQPN